MKAEIDKNSQLGKQVQRFAKGQPLTEGYDPETLVSAVAAKKVSLYPWLGENPQQAACRWLCNQLPHSRWGEATEALGYKGLPCHFELSASESRYAQQQIQTDKLEIVSKKLEAEKDTIEREKSRLQSLEINELLSVLQTGFLREGETVETIDELSKKEPLVAFKLVLLEKPLTHARRQVADAKSAYEKEKAELIAAVGKYKR